MFTHLVKTTTRFRRGEETVRGRKSALVSWTSAFLVLVLYLPSLNFTCVDNQVSAYLQPRYCFKISSDSEALLIEGSKCFVQYTLRDSQIYC